MRCFGGAVFFAGMLLVTPLCAEILIQQASVQWAALGNASVAKSTGVESLATNPSGLISSDRANFVSGYASHFQNSYVSGILGAVVPLSDSLSVGAVGALRRVDGIPESIDQNGIGVQVGSFSDTQWESKLGFSLKLSPEWTVGSSLGMYSHSVFSESGTQFSIDLGTQFQMDAITLGASMTNITESGVEWTTGHVDPDSRRLSLGLSLDLSPVTGLAAVSMDSYRTEYDFGVIYRVGEHLQLFGGMHDVFDQGQFSLGVNVMMESFSVIYTYAQAGDLGETHKMGVALGL